MNVDYKKIISLAGAIVAFSIGSGFATGQEILQFFSSYGLVGCLGAALITFILYIWVCSVVMTDGKKLQLENANDIWIHYCGKYLGTALKYFAIFFIFCCLVVMTSGAGATINEYYGLPTLVGRVLITILMLVTVLLGRDKINGLIGVIGVVIIIFAVLVGAVSLIQNVGNLGNASAYLAEHTVSQAAPHWTISGILYMTFMAMTLLPFLSGLSFSCKDDREAKMGGIAGGIAFMACLLIMALAILASIEITGQVGVPTLAIAKAVSPVFGAIFSVILIAGIFTTTVSLLWMTCNFVSADEKSTKFRVTAVVVCAIVLVGSKLPFGTLVNIVYPYTGYIGAVVCLFIVYKHYFVKTK